MHLPTAPVPAPSLAGVGEIRSRREPPPFRPVEVVAVTTPNPHVIGITLAGESLEGFDPGLPAASVRLLLPRTHGELEIPTWRGNEFLHADDTRPLLRTLTPLRFDPSGPSLDVEVVLHGSAPLSDWAAGAGVGNRVALSGPGRGYEIDDAGTRFLIAGDESALPAVTTVIPALPAAARVDVLVEVRHDDARRPLPDHPGLRARWLLLADGKEPGEALVAAVTSAEIDADTRVWAAGEAAAVQRIRRHLFGELELPRARAVVRGYWKRGRSEH